MQDLSESPSSDRQLRAREAVSRTLAAWDSFDAPVEALLEALGSAIGSAAGAIWVPDPRADVLGCSAFWSEPGVDTGELRAASTSLRLPGRMTLLGAAWKTGRPISVEDVGDEDAFILRDPATRAGLHGWVAVPARARQEVVALVEFYGARRESLPAELIETLEDIGGQLGQFFAWRRSELLSEPELTDREREILRLVAQGQSGVDTARELGVRPATVKSHLRNIYEKLRVSNRAAAVAEGMRRGLIY
jgi:two-component system, NarL family, nitrate/nitrite response regulator NarL